MAWHGLCYIEGRGEWIMEVKAVILKNEKSCRGQGMVEYVLVLAIVVAIAITAMGAVAILTSTLVNVLVDNIETVTGVESTTN